MKTEKQKMLLGELYDPLDKELSDERLYARLLIKQLNDSREVLAEEKPNFKITASKQWGGYLVTTSLLL